MADERQPMLAGQQNKMYSQAQGYPPQPGYPPQQGQGYPPPTQGGYPPAQGGYPPAQGGYPPAQGGYPGAQGGYQQQAPPQGGGYPPPQGPPPGDAQGADSPSYKGEVPDDDVEFDPNAASSGPPQPTAPPADKMDQVSGYNVMDAPLPPPPPPLNSEAVQPTREAVSQAPSMTDEEAREALLSYVAEDCCRGKKAATEMKVNDLQHSAAFHYTLETFTEKRTTKWMHEPFTGQIIDGPHNGPAPMPWSIMVNIPAMFKDGKTKLEVPHTASVKPCHDCHAIGFRRCHHCMGRGRTRCHMCHGHGRRHVSHYNHEEHRHHSHWETCHSCHGMGRRRCFTCHGHGQITCSTCSGRANLKFYIQLTVNWTNHLNDSIVERTALPDELIRDVTGQVAFKEEQPRVFPVNHFPDQAINQASNTLVQQHSTAFQLERIIQQRHQVRIIPVTEVRSTYDEKPFVFFVYGFEHKVHAPEYPMQCCCGCTIL